MTIYSPNDLTTLNAAFVDADGDAVYFKSVEGQLINWSSVASVDVPLLGGTLRIYQYGALNPPQFIGADDGQNGPGADKTLTATVNAVISDGVNDVAVTLSVSVYGRPSVPFGFATQPSVSPGGTVAVGTTLTGNVGALEGGTAPYSTSIKWYKAGAAIPGATTTSYTTVAGDSNATDIYMEVTATDSSVPANTVVGRSADVAVTTAALKMDIAPILTGTGETGFGISATDGFWVGNDPFTFAFQWKKNGVDIPGATNKTYTLSAPDQGASFTCQVTCTDAVGKTNSYLAGPKVAIAPGGPKTFDTEEAILLAEFAKHPDNGWAGFPDETGFTVITATTPDAAMVAFNTWKNGSPDTAKVKVLCQWNGILDCSSLRWSGPTAAKLVADANEYRGWKRSQGGFWLAKAPGYNPVWGSTLQISSGFRFHVTGMRFAGKLPATATRNDVICSVQLDMINGNMPWVVFFEDCNFGQKDNRPGAVYADYCGGVMVSEGAYSARYKNCRFAGCANSVRSRAVFNWGWKIDFQDTFADIRSCTGFDTPANIGRMIYNYWELVLVRDMHQNAAATGKHTDLMQTGQGGFLRNKTTWLLYYIGDRHAGYRTVHKYVLAHMASYTANDSGSQGFYNDDAKLGQEFNLSVKEAVVAPGAWHIVTHYDPSRAGTYRIQRLMGLRSSWPSKARDGSQSDTKATLTGTTNPITNGGSFVGDHITIAKLSNPGSMQLSNVRFCNSSKSTPAGNDGLTEGTAKRLEEYITGTGGTITRDGINFVNYDIPGERSTDFATAWWALRDFYTPIAGWGTTGVPNDPGTWPGVPPRP